MLGSRGSETVVNLRAERKLGRGATCKWIFYLPLYWFKRIYFCFNNTLNYTNTSKYKSSMNKCFEYGHIFKKAGKCAYIYLCMGGLLPHAGTSLAD